MAVWSPSVGIGGSCCLLNNGITEAWRFPSTCFSTCNNKTKRGSKTLRVTSALQSYHRLSKILASKTSTELKEEISARSAQVDDLKKVTTSYSFRTKSGALVKVKVENKRDKYSIMVYVSSLELSGCDDDNKSSSSLVMVWGVYRSDSSCFLPLDFESFSQDSQTHTTETPFVKGSLSESKLGLEFDGKESPFYLSFRLKNPNGGLEMLTHRDIKFCVPVGFTAGHPLPLGLSSGPDDDNSWNFAFFSRNAKSVVLCLYDDTTTDKPALELDLDPYVNRTGDVWHASVEKTWEFVRYGYCCHSEEEVEAEDIVLDPYARVIEKSISQKFLGSLSKSPSFDWGRDASPNIPLEKLNVYRLNVKGFTQHKSSKLPTNIAGTFTGVAERVNHLKTLGANAVLLEPIFSFSEQQGPYFPFHFFSPMDMYGPSNSMKEMVKRLHSEGIEVLLEVVFTHTADSGALHGIDDSCYYLDSKSYLNCNFPVVQELVLESLRYWVTEFHVDGFSFINASSLLRGVHGEHLSRPPLVEAISFDPLLAGRKLIADCWDPHDMKMPKEVRFPHWKRWGEVNTRYCRNVRNFLRGRGLLSDLATRICGSGDVFTDGRGPAFSFNYISRNSGFSLVDLVSFSGPEVASELSWNCGEEGATNKSAVLQTRLKQIRNFLFIQYVSLGIPVLNMGDECGVSTKGLGSRKAFDWNMLASAFGVQITQFISFMTSVRARRSDVFQRRDFLKPENIVWYANDQTTPKWEDPGSKFLALEIKAETEEETTASLVEPTEPKNNDLFIGFNASDQPENVILPSLPSGRKWRRLVDTALPFPGFFSVEGETVVAEEEEEEEEMNQPVMYEMKPYNDFGVLHRNEASGALSGLTRVRRFQQDDAHIFCTEDQVTEEVKAVLEFIDYAYKIFGFTYELKLSTRPEKYLGDLATWDKAENDLKVALDAFGKTWQLNEGDGAFYGPKIDITVSDALNRKFQCATLQLDFQLPDRFKLEYSGDDEAKRNRPVMIHRAVLGSVERMFAILLEHYKGKWPFWLSPRQAIVCPISKKSEEYALKVKEQIHEAGYYVDADITDRKIDKKVREAQLAQYNYILVVGETEAATGQVSVRIRDSAAHSVKSIDDLLEEFKTKTAEYQ